MGRSKFFDGAKVKLHGAHGALVHMVHWGKWSVGAPHGVLVHPMECWCTPSPGGASRWPVGWPPPLRGGLTNRCSPLTPSHDHLSQEPPSHPLASSGPESLSPTHPAPRYMDVVVVVDMVMVDVVNPSQGGHYYSITSFVPTVCCFGCGGGWMWWWL